MRILFQTFDRVVVEREGGFEIQRRPGAPFLIAGGCVAAAAVFTGIGRVLQGSESLSGTGWFCAGAARLIAGLAVVVLCAALVVLINPRARLHCRLDPRQGMLLKGRRSIPLDTIEAFRLAPFQESWISLVAALRGGQPLMLLTAGAAHRPALEAVASRLNDQLSRREDAPAKAEARPVDLRPEASRLFVTIAMVTGALWVGCGYFFFEGIYLSRRGAPEIRFPVWALGFIFLAVGVWQWIRGNRRGH